MRQPGQGRTQGFLTNWLGFKLVVCSSLFLSTSVDSADLERDPMRARLEASVRVLAETIGPRTFRTQANLNATAEFITRSFESAGYTVTFHSYDVQGLTVRNIIAERRGSEEPDRVLIVGAHYDLHRIRKYCRTKSFFPRSREIINQIMAVKDVIT